MAELVYDKTGRLLFTKEMKKEYTILMPQMLPIHFGMFQKMLQLEGYNVVQLNNEGQAVVDEGLKYVHNDTCYPALLVIGQFLDAIKHGGYDPHKVALFITQTGGGCRASNYIHLLRKALEKAGMGYIPVISISFGLEKNPGFHLTIPLLRRLIYAMMYGDLIMNVANQVRPYEVNAGETDFVLLLAKEDEIEDGMLDTAKVKAFRVPAGTAVEVYGTTLHYAPCQTTEAGFRVAVVLPKGTNTEKPVFEAKSEEDTWLTARNKWLLAHPDSSEAKTGAHIGLTGKNIDILDA